MPRSPISFAIAVMSTAAACTVDRDAGPTGAEPSDPPAAEAGAAVVGTKWQWTGTTTPVERIAVTDPSRYTIRLGDDGNAEIEFDCNRGSGKYSITEHGLSFGMFLSTRMACPEDSQDFVFMSELEKISSYFVSDGNLYLEMPYDSGTMRFERSPEQD